MNPETSPFLVTKTKGGVLWIEEAPAGKIRAGVCASTPSEIFMSVVDAVADRGQELEWGNVHPYSLEGIKAAADYLTFFGFTDMEVLVPRIRLPKKVQAKKNKKLNAAIEAALGKQEETLVERPKWLNPKTVGLPLCPTSWLPEDCAVVVPAERAYVGELTHINTKYLAVIVHNPSRGMAIARGKPA